MRVRDEQLTRELNEAMRGSDVLAGLCGQMARALATVTVIQPMLKSTFSFSCFFSPCPLPELQRSPLAACPAPLEGAGCPRPRSQRDPPAPQHQHERERAARRRRAPRSSSWHARTPVRPSSSSGSSGWRSLPSSSICRRSLVSIPNNQLCTTQPGKLPPPCEQDLALDLEGWTRRARELR